MAQIFLYKENNNNKNNYYNNIVNKELTKKLSEIVYFHSINDTRF